MAPHFSNLLETAIFPALIMKEKVYASAVIPVFSTDQISRDCVGYSNFSCTTRISSKLKSGSLSARDVLDQRSKRETN